MPPNVFTTSQNRHNPFTFFLSSAYLHANLSLTNMNPLLKCPNDLFQQIERIITERPELLSQFHFHELASGREAYTEEQILEEDTKHCLAGFIVALTPKAAGYEHLREDVDTFANEILRSNGRLPIPSSIFYADEDSARKIILGRSAEERAAAFLVVPRYDVN